MKVRLSAELRRQVEAAARANNRTLNSEIVSRLERSFEEEATSDARSKLAAERILRMNLTGQPDPMKEIDALKEQVADLEKRLSELEKPAVVEDAPLEGASLKLTRKA
jgi:ubiquinone biosynthesis protein UbiJ